MVLVAMGAALLANGGSLLAQPSATDKETARAAWKDGLEKQKDGDHAGALKLFRAAHALMGLPMTGVEVARELAALGQIAEACDVALSVAKMMAAKADKRFVSEARSLYESLAKRLGTILLTISGAPSSGARVRVDGLEVPAASVEAPRKVNPGSHTILVDADGCAPVSRTVSIAEGGSESVAIVLVPFPPKRPSGDTTDPAVPQGPHETIPRAVTEMIGKYVVLTAKDERVLEGRLVSADDTSFVVQQYDGQPATIERTQARSIHLREGDEPHKPREAPAPDPDGLVKLHVESSDPTVGLYRTKSVAVGLQGWTWGHVVSLRPEYAEQSVLVCTAPCDKYVDGRDGRQFFFKGADTEPSDEFRLVGKSGEYTARVSPATELRHGGGALLLGVGITGLVGSISLSIVGAVTDFRSTGQYSWPAGAVAGGVSSGLLGLGIYFLATGSTTFQLVPGIPAVAGQGATGRAVLSPGGLSVRGQW